MSQCSPLPIPLKNALFTGLVLVSLGRLLGQRIQLEAGLSLPVSPAALGLEISMAVSWVLEPLSTHAGDSGVSENCALQVGALGFNRPDPDPTNPMVPQL